MVTIFSFDFDKHSKYILTTDWHQNESVGVHHSKISYLLIYVEWNSIQTEKENAGMIPLQPPQKKHIISIQIFMFPTFIQLHPSRTAINILFFIFASHFWQRYIQRQQSESTKPIDWCIGFFSLWHF